jgi:putative Mn2+ efflux pump MntP
MLWLGSYGGFVFSFSNYGHFYPLLIAGIFLTLSSKFFLDSFKTIHREIIWGILPLLALGLATSIDALASGLSLGTLPLTHLIALDIGLITFLLCLLFYGVAQIFKNIPEKWLLRLAGVIFLGLGLNIILVEFFKDIL